jgi:hypothetical protein
LNTVRVSISSSHHKGSHHPKGSSNRKESSCYQSYPLNQLMETILLITTRPQDELDNIFLRSLIISSPQSQNRDQQ